MVYHLGAQAFSQAALVLNGATSVNVINGESCRSANQLPLIQILPDNKVELGRSISSGALQAGDAVSTKLGFVVRGAHSLLDSVGNAQTGDNLLALTIMGDREVTLARAHKTLTPDEEHQVLEAHDRSARIALNQADSIGDLEGFLRKNLSGYLQNRNANDPMNERKDPVPTFSPIRITDDLLMQATQEHGEMLVTFEGTWQGIANYLQVTGDLLSDASVLCRGAALGHFSELQNFAFRLDRETFDTKTRKKNPLKINVKKQAGHTELVAGLQEKWGLSKVIAKWILDGMMYLPFDPESQLDMELLASYSSEHGTALLTAHNHQQKAVPSVFRYSTDDGKEAVHHNFGFRRDPYPFYQEVENYLRQSPELRPRDGMRWLQGPALPEMVKLSRLSQRDFFTPDATIRWSSSEFLPLFLDRLLKAIKKLSPQRTNQTDAAQVNSHQIQPGQSENMLFERDDIYFNVTSKITEEGGKPQKMDVFIAFSQELSAYRVRKLSRGEDDFDYDNVPEASLTLDGEVMQFTEIGLQDADVVETSYVFYDLPVDRQHTIVVSSPPKRGKKTESVEVIIGSI